MRIAHRAIYAAGLLFVTSMSWVSTTASEPASDPIAARLIGALNATEARR